MQQRGGSGGRNGESKAPAEPARPFDPAEFARNPAYRLQQAEQLTKARREQRERENGTAPAAKVRQPEPLPFIPIERRKEPRIEEPQRSSPPAPSPEPVNPEPGKPRQERESDRMARFRARLVEQALNISDAMPQNATEEARAGLKQLWARIKGLGDAIEWQQLAEEAAALQDAKRTRDRDR